MKFQITALLFLALVIIVAVWYGAYKYRNEIADFFMGDGKQTVLVGSSQLRVDVVDTKETIEKGLSGRESLPINDGMLFIFPKAGKYRMWMKDMQFPIDIIWVGNDRKIVHIEENVSPESYPNTFAPNEPARFVIEANAFWAREHNTEVGQTVVIPELVLPRDLRQDLFSE